MESRFKTKLSYIYTAGTVQNYVAFTKTYDWENFAAKIIKSDGKANGLQCLTCVASQ